MTELTREYLKQRLHYDPDTGIFTWIKCNTARFLPGTIAGGRAGPRYRVIGLNQQLYLEHRLAFFYMEGRWPLEVDHVNGVGSDNRWVNLREATRSQNLFNRRPRNETLGVSGVSQNPKSLTWRARIVVNSREISLGYFKTKEEAVAARKAAEEIYQKEFAWRPPE